MNFVAQVHRRAIAAYLLVIVLAAIGVLSYLRLPSSIFPSITFPVIRIIANAGEEPAISVIPTLTRPLEDALVRIPGVRLVRSITSRGSVELTAQFQWGTDMKFALQRAEAETQRIRPKLPARTSIEIQWMNTATYPIEGYALTSDHLTQAELRDLAEYRLKPELIRIPGVSQVQVQGGRKREFRVNLNPLALEGHRLSVTDVVRAIRSDNLIESTGLVPSHHELYLSFVDGQVHNLNDLENISVPVKGGVPARLSELGNVSSADEVSYIRTSANGKPAVLLNIVRQPAGDTVRIADAIRELFRKNPKLLPPGVQWSSFYDQARFVSQSVNGTLTAILIGVLLAAIVLLVFLRSWRLSLIAVLNIPLTAAIVALGVSITGKTVNLMTLAGVAAAIGLIADDAIVVIENISHHIEGQKSSRNSGEAAERGLREILPALIGSSLSTIVILLPFSLLSGVTGAFFKPLAFTMGLSLVVSFFLAWILIPVNVASVGLNCGKASRVLALLKSAVGSAVSKLGEPVGHRYHQVTGFFVRQGWIPGLLLLSLLAGAYWIHGHLPTNFLPSMDEGSIILDYWTPPGTSLSDTDRMLGEVEKVILSLPDVSTYSRRTGTQMGFFITEPNRGDYVINLKGRGERRPIEQVISILRKRIEQVEPAIHRDFGQLLEDNLGDLSGGTPQPVDVKVFGENIPAIQKTAKQISSIVTSIPGTADVFDGIVVSGPTLQIRFDPIKGARYGMTSSDLHTELSAAILGEVVGKVRVQDRNYDLRVLSSEGGIPFESRDRPLGQMRIRTPSGALLAVDDIAHVVHGAPESEIDRENLRTYVGVTARLSGTSLGAAMGRIRSKIASEVHLTDGMKVEYGGLYEEQQTSFRELLWLLLASLILVSIVVLFEFADWRAPIVTTCAAAATLSGVFAAIWFTGSSLNISSYVGAIMMVGIVGENTIFVLHEGRLELASGKNPAAAWAAASRRRLRPVAMTVLATVLALAPLAFAVGQGSQLLQPLAIAVIGGFVVSGPVVLWVVPGLYRLLDPQGRLRL